MIFINLLTTMWMRVIDDLRQPVVVTVQALPPQLADRQDPPPPSPPVLTPPPTQVRARVLEVSAFGYADDTYACSQDGAPMTPKMDAVSLFLTVTGQEVNAKKSVAYDSTGQQPEGSELDGQAMPLQTDFRSLGAGIRTTGVAGSGPLIQGRMREAARMLPRIHGAQGGFDRRAEVISTLILPTGLHAAALANIARGDLARLDTAVLKALWGPTRPCRAKEVVVAFFCAGHRVLPIMVCVCVCVCAMFCYRGKPICGAASSSPMPAAAQGAARCVCVCRALY